MLDLQTIAEAIHTRPFDTDETIDLLVETVMLAPANAVRVIGIVRIRKNTPAVPILQVDVNGVLFVVTETTAAEAMSRLCTASGSHERQEHLVELALQIGAAICEANSLCVQLQSRVH